MPPGELRRQVLLNVLPPPLELLHTQPLPQRRPRRHRCCVMHLRRLGVRDVRRAGAQCVSEVDQRRARSSLCVHIIRRSSEANVGVLRRPHDASWAYVPPAMRQGGEWAISDMTGLTQTLSATRVRGARGWERAYSCSAPGLCLAK